MQLETVHQPCSPAPHLNDGVPFGNGVIMNFFEKGKIDAKAWQPVIEDPFWDATLVNLGLHYNKPDASKYQDDVNTLLNLMRKARAASRARFFGFIGSTPQHFNTSDGTFSQGRCRHLRSPEAARECKCVALKGDGTANRWRNDM
eukprot:3998884-Pyramimonas_sp.AAC.1